MALVDTRTAEDFYAYLQRLYGRSYGSNDESSIFQRQLRSWAVLLATGHADVDRAFANAFPDLADEMVTDWETAFNLPNDSARTLAERQARLGAHVRTQKGAARSDLQATLDATGALASFVANRRDEVLMAGSEDAAIFQTTLQLANEDFYDPILREAIETLYTNAIPAKHVGALDKLGRGQNVCVETEAEWNSTSHHVGRDTIARQVAVARTEFMSGNQVARVRGFGPGSRLDAKDLNRIQETALGCPLTDELQLVDFSTVSAGLTQYWFGAECLDGVATLLDQSIDWRDRMLLALFTFSRDDVGTKVDIVPSGADDDQWGDNSTGGDGEGDVDQSSEIIYVYTGSGSTGATVYRGFHTNDAINLALYSDTAGDLYMLSTGDDYFASGVIFVTPDLDKR